MLAVMKVFHHDRTPVPAMTLNPEPKYPTRRAYVVKVRADAKPDDLSGRLENVVTGERRDFASGQELLESIARDLQAIARKWLPDSPPK
jgi:hypothetical protein